MTIGADGLHIEDPGSITTATGKRVNPLDLHVEDIDIADIARALSRQCRYNGHVGGFLSVARHSIWVAEGLPAHLRLEGLLHDAAETYLGDLVRPLKHSEFGKVYVEAEQRAEAVIAEKFGLAWPMPAEVKAEDNAVLTETELPDARWTWHETPDRTEELFMEFFKMYSDPSQRIAPSPRYIGLSGRKQSGKDTVGNYLVEKHGFTRVAFADKMREALLALDPLVTVGAGAYLSELVADVGWDKAKQNPEVRRLLQKFGTEAGRDIHGQNCWVDAVMNDLPKGNIVFTDVRFPNEAEAIKDLGGQVWRVVRPTAPKPQGEEHVSETALDAWTCDRLIINDGTMDDLYDQVEYYLGKVDSGVR